MRLKPNKMRTWMSRSGVYRAAAVIITVLSLNGSRCAALTVYNSEHPWTFREKFNIEGGFKIKQWMSIQVSSQNKSPHNNEKPQNNLICWKLLSLNIRRIISLSHHMLINRLFESEVGGHQSTGMRYKAYYWKDSRATNSWNYVKIPCNSLSWSKGDQYSQIIIWSYYS